MSALATETVSTPSVGLTATDLKAIRARADDDVFYFGRVICGHRDLVYEDHAPLMYAAAGDAAKLLSILRNPALDSYTIRRVRQECARLAINLTAEDAEGRLSEHLRVVDERVYRHSGKSSAITHAVRTWKISKDPNLTSCLITNTDDKAKDFCKQIRATILSSIYAAVYPDRVPSDPKSMLTENRITVAGRTVPDMEPCLMAFGVKSSPTGYHYDEFHFDDLVGRENKSVAELAVVYEFLANLSGMYKPGIRYRVRRVHVGTRWGDDDDAAYVRNYSKCFTITVPIWVRDTQTDDLRTHGTPTTSWYPLEKILAEQEEVLSNPDEGAISWRCNYELDPSLAGGKIFPDQLVDGSHWTPFIDSKITEGKEWCLRPQYDEKTRKPLTKGRAFDPTTLYKVMCVDQAFSEGDDADEWAIAVVGMDQFGHRFVLEVRTGHGVREMLDAMEVLRLMWNPKRIGMEKIAAQEVIKLVLNLDVRYRRLFAMCEDVPHKNAIKEYRIRNFVAEVMKMHMLWTHPRDTETSFEMKKYKPGPKAKDNRLDALAMCEVILKRSLAPKDENGEDDYKKKFAKLYAAKRARRDPSTGVQLW